MHEETLRLDRKRVEWREVDGEIIALDLKASMYLAVSSHSGDAAWTALAEGTTGDELLARVLAGFRVGREEAERDLDAFLKDLDDRGLLLREVS